MGKVQIKDLPKDVAISKEEMKRVRGGAFDCFLKIDGIKGEATGPEPVEDVSLNRAVDQASPKMA